MGLSWKESSLRYKRRQALDPATGPKDLTKRRQYDSKSAKVWRDRYESARRSLKQDIEWYVRRHNEGRAHDFLTGPIRRHDWTADKYRKARAEMKRRGLL